MGKQWFLIHEGMQTGPFSLDELKAKTSAAEIDPRLDKVWSEGMDDWIPAGELSGLFQRNEGSAPAHPIPPTSSRPHPPQSTQPSTEVPAEAIQPGGTNRQGYFFVMLIFPALWWVTTTFLANYIVGEIEPELLRKIVAASFIIPFLIAITATFSRLRNLHMSRLWFLGLFVPLLNLWLGYRLFACPQGYAIHDEQDGVGWFLAIIYWLVITLLLVAVVAISLSLAGMLTDNQYIEPYLDHLEPYLEKLKIK